MTENNLTRIVDRELPPLAAGLVHEVKNPLAAIHLHLQLLESYIAQVKDPDLRGKMLDKAAVIKKEIVGLNQTLHDFLRRLRDAAPVEKQIGDLNTVVQDVIQLLEPQALHESIKLEFHPGELKASAFEPTFVKQILVNLILNSVEAFAHSPQQDKQIQVETGMDGKHPFLRVRDNGPGIPPELQVKIFEPLFSTKEEGSGLGLALVQKMTGEMGGDVRVHSQPGRGAEFTIVLGGPAH